MKVQEEFSGVILMLILADPVNLKAEQFTDDKVLWIQA